MYIIWWGEKIVGVAFLSRRFLFLFWKPKGTCISFLVFLICKMDLEMDLEMDIEWM
jgi:hypothetical protein